MTYVNRLQNVTVLGAGGKMGSGILLLTAMEMTDLSLLPENKDKDFIINAVDVSDKALSGLMDFLKTQVTKAAEKKTVILRETYKDRSDLIENSDIINQYVFDVMKIVRCTTRLEPCYDSTLIFEAIKEDPDLKVKILSQIVGNNKKSPWFFTNTSSIPIHELDESAKLDGRILGFHFYNPPAVQKLAELISSDSTQKEVIEFALQYAKKLRKTIVHSNDVAGFIGNGHFMRDALFGISEVERLSEKGSFVEAVYKINKVSQDFLIRPMGIFQLVDYVGLDVCSYIMSVMNSRLSDQNLHSSLLDSLIVKGVVGGQFADGSQKDGLLKYEKGRPVGIYNPDEEEYTLISEFQEKCDKELGTLPKATLPWRAVIGNPAKKDILSDHFKELNSMKTLGAELAGNYGEQSKKIALQLVTDNVARNEEDVNTILLTGFYHSYGPINEYFK
ncbi:3-hydroxyacyl-CoA dehydrogenase family protein [candidate division KSB1 bacterium]|nr:3-hydroxyacyl-CoA dehydrogenase family protein [candidate division KSB1 bacterium]